MTKQTMKSWQKRWNKGMTDRSFYSIQRKTGDMRRTERTRGDETISLFVHFGLNSTQFVLEKHMGMSSLYGK